LLILAGEYTTSVSPTFVSEQRTEVKLFQHPSSGFVLQEFMARQLLRVAAGFDKYPGE
jgi:hypothetical protein